MSAHICFVAPAMYPVLAGERGVALVGGAEVQQSILARAFVAHGYRVSVLSFDYGQSDDCEIDGIRIVKIVRDGPNMPGLCYVYPRLTAIWRAMAAAGADIYYQRCAGAYTGVAAAFSRAHRRKFIFACASDRDLLRGDANILRGWRDRQLFGYGLRGADAVVVQTPAQRQNYRSWIKREATLIPSCYVKNGRVGESSAASPVVLWVGAMRPEKRPQLFIDLALRLPQLRFRMVGGPSRDPGGDAFYEGLAQRARGVPNLIFSGFVAYADIDGCFDDARLLVNTSDFEGFPNTFLQAWSRAMPTLSFFDCGARDAYGAIAAPLPDLDAMAATVGRLMRDDDGRAALGLRCRAHFQQHHAVDTAVAAYRLLFSSLMTPAVLAQQDGVPWP